MLISYEILKQYYIIFLNGNNVTVGDSSFGDHRKSIETAVLEMYQNVTEIYVGRMQVLETIQHVD